MCYQNQIYFLCISTLFLAALYNLISLSTCENRCSAIETSHQTWSTYVLHEWCTNVTIFILKKMIKTY